MTKPAQREVLGKVQNGIIVPLDEPANSWTADDTLFAIKCAALGVLAMLIAHWTAPLIFGA